MAGFSVQCPKCQNPLEVPAELSGQQVSCPMCGNVFAAVQPYGAASSPQVQPPMSTPYSAGNNFAPPSGGSRPNYGSSSGLPVLLSIVAVLLGAAALVKVFFFSDVPYLEFKKDPSDALRAKLECEIKARSLQNYGFRKYGKKVLKSLEVKQVIKAGDQAAVFYTLSRGASTYNDVDFFDCLISDFF